MSKLSAFIQLDFLTIKPYLKSIWFVLGLGLVLSVVQGNAYAVIGIYMAYSMLIVSYPFAIEDKNSLNVLYSSLSIRRGHAVLGRYAFSLVLYGGITLISIFLSIMMSIVLHYELTLSAMAAVFSFGFMFFSIILSIQLPIYFRLGYTKGKMMANAPLILMVIFISSFGVLTQYAPVRKLFDTIELLLTAKDSALYIIPVIIGVIALLLSYTVSLTSYEKRDL